VPDDVRRAQTGSQSASQLVEDGAAAEVLRPAARDDGEQAEAPRAAIRKAALAQQAALELAGAEDAAGPDERRLLIAGLAARQEHERGPADSAVVSRFRAVGIPAGACRHGSDLSPLFGVHPFLRIQSSFVGAVTGGALAQWDRWSRGVDHSMELPIQARTIP
jgi:hypothetical protein